MTSRGRAPALSTATPPGPISASRPSPGSTVPPPGDDRQGTGLASWWALLERRRCAPPPWSSSARCGDSDAARLRLSKSTERCSVVLNTERGSEQNLLMLAEQTHAVPWCCHKRCRQSRSGKNCGTTSESGAGFKAEKQRAVPPLLHRPDAREVPMPEQRARARQRPRLVARRHPDAFSPPA